MEEEAAEMEKKAAEAMDLKAAEEVSSDESAADDEDLAPAEPALVHDHALDAVAGMDAARIAELYMKRIVAVDAPDTLVSPPSRRTAQKQPAKLSFRV